MKPTRVRKRHKKAKAGVVNRAAIKLILILIMLGLTGLTFAWTYHFFTTSPHLAIGAPVIEAKEGARKKRILDGFNLYCRTYYDSVHPNIFQLNLKGLADYLRLEPGVKEVEVKRQLPKTVKILVKERKPLAIIPVPGTGRFLGVDREGVIFGLDSGEEYDLPFITGVELEGYKLGEPLKAVSVKEVLAIIDQVGDPEIDLLSQIAEFNIADPKGLIGYTVRQATQIRFGRPGHEIKEKLLRLKFLLKYLREREERKEYIDLRFKDIVMK